MSGNFPSHRESFPLPCLCSTELQTKTKMVMLEGDILDAQCLRRACQGISVVIHAAAVIDVSGVIPRKTIMDINLKGTVPEEEIEQSRLGREAPCLLATPR